MPKPNKRVLNQNSHKGKTNPRPTLRSLAKVKFFTNFVYLSKFYFWTPSGFFSWHQQYENRYHGRHQLVVRRSKNACLKASDRVRLVISELFDSRISMTC